MACSSGFGGGKGGGAFIGAAVQPVVPVTIAAAIVPFGGVSCEKMTCTHTQRQTG